MDFDAWVDSIRDAESSPLYWNSYDAMRAAYYAGAKAMQKTAADKARDLERMCAELAASGICAFETCGKCSWCVALAKWQAMQPK